MLIVVRKTRRMVQTSTIKTIENLMYITIAAYGGLTSTTVAARWAIRLKFKFVNLIRARSLALIILAHLCAILLSP